MKLRKPDSIWQLQWHFLFLGLTAIGLIVGILAQAFEIFSASFYILIYFAVVVSIFAILLLVYEAVKSLKAQQSALSDISKSVKSNMSLLEQICRVVKLSEVARTIAYRDMDRQQLRSTVIEKLHQQDFDSTYSMIADISRHPEYKALADELKTAADNYRDATDNERANQVINYIEKLLDQYQWTTAGVQTERLIKKYPDLESAKAIQKKLFEKKELRKRELLGAWDEAIKKDDTDRSLRILKELDLYLTPSEGLALQEAASEVFKNKLHNIGVQFSLAVADKQWTKALAAAEEIIHDFPNSRMADEIRAKVSILKELAKK